MTCLGVLERGEQGDDNETCLKERGGIEMSIYSAPFACRSFAEIPCDVSFVRYDVGWCKKDIGLMLFLKVIQRLFSKGEREFATQ